MNNHGHNHDHSHEEEEFDIKVAEEVGAASFEALNKAKAMIKPGVRLVDVANTVEAHLKERGFGCAFPLNLSINEQAAHYTPSFMDEKVFSDKDVVKVDFGAAKNGILGDCALTVDLSGMHSELVEATKLALDNAISVIKDGVTVSEIGREIGQTIESAGFLPIMNLGGHGVGVHNLHADIFIANYDNHDDTQLEEGMVVAIEPFATDGKKGYVVENEPCDIYGFVGETQLRQSDARALMKEMVEKYNSEPFAVRWLSNVVDSKFNLYLAIKEVRRQGAITPYPTLVTSAGGNVSQAELEVIVEKDGCKILTK